MPSRRLPLKTTMATTMTTTNTSTSTMRLMLTPPPPIERTCQKDYSPPPTTRHTTPPTLHQVVVVVTDVAKRARRLQLRRVIGRMLLLCRVRFKCVVCDAIYCIVVLHRYTYANMPYPALLVVLSSVLPLSFSSIIGQASIYRAGGSGHLRLPGYPSPPHHPRLVPLGAFNLPRVVVTSSSMKLRSAADWLRHRYS